MEIEKNSNELVKHLQSNIAALMHQIKQTQISISKFQDSTNSIIKEVKNTNIKSKFDVIIEYMDIYKEYQHKYILSHQLNNEAAQMNLLLDNALSNEKDMPLPENETPQEEQKPPTRQRIKLQNFPSKSSATSRPIAGKLTSAYIHRRKYVSQEVKKVVRIENQSENKPITRSSLPSLKGTRIDTDPRMTLESLFNPEIAKLFKNYSNLIQRFKTNDPNKIFNLFENIRKNNGQLERRFNLVKHDVKKLQNKIFASKLMLKGMNEVYKATLHKIDAINAAFNINVQGTPYMKILQLKDYVKEIIKERRQKKLSESRTKKAINYANVVQIKRVKQNVVKINPEYEVPAIMLTAENIKGDYMPATRITRRTFEDMKIKSALNENDILSFGNLLGSAMTERFASTFIVFPHVHYKEDEFEIIRPARITLKPSELEIPKIVLATITMLYKDNSSNLHLSVFSNEEINAMAPDFLTFISLRDQLYDVFEKMFDEKLFSEFFSNLLNEDSTAACYLARDFTNRLSLKNSVPYLLGKMVPFFVKIDNQETMLPFYSAFDCFLRISSNSSFRNQILILVTEKTTKFVDELVNRPMTNFVRAALTIMLSFGYNFPEQFAQHCTLRAECYSTAQNYLVQSKEYKTCVLISVQFFTVVKNSLDEESIQWHLAYFMHLVMHELTRQVLRIDIIIALLEAITAIVANRSQLISDQLVSTHFMDFLMKNIGLEELIDNKLGHQDNTINKYLQQPPQQQFKFNLQRKVSQQDMDKVLPLLNLDNPKTQLAFSFGTKPYKKSESISKKDYLDMRESMPIYFNMDIHVKFVQLIFALFVDHSLHHFDNVFVDPFPQVNRRPNVLFTLMRHMEMRENEMITPLLNEAYSPEIPKLIIPVLKKTYSDKTSGKLTGNLPLTSDGNRTLPSFISNTIQDDLILKYSKHNLLEEEKQNNKKIEKNDEMEQFHNYQRLLKLLVPGLFSPEEYRNGQHIASGAFGSVMAVMVDDKKVAVKILQKSRDTYDNPKLVDVFAEISILELCKGDRRVTQLLNYGCTTDSYYIVMEFYPMTLKSWRKRFDNSPPLPTILRLFKEFLNATTVLLDHRINHFDIKCDNVVLDYRGYPALADFGESICYKNEASSFTMFNKGTEWIKSPEMLSIAINASVNNPAFDRRRQVGAGPASDVWSIGCLFYELLTGEFLFVDTDWSRFFTRVTDPKEALITPQCMKKLPKDMRFSAFIEFVLQRTVGRRPSLSQVIAKFDEYFPDAMDGPLPVIEEVPAVVSSITFDYSEHEEDILSEDSHEDES